jgi:hypothetical protein
MERHRTVRDPLLRLRTEIGQLADDPTAVAALIGVQCFLFSALYYGALAFGQLDRLLAGEWRPVAAIAGLFVLTVVNAVGVTWIVWRVVDLDSTRSYWYGAGAAHRRGCPFRSSPSRFRCSRSTS